MVDILVLVFSFVAYPEVAENRIGLDGKWDLGIGLWVEGTWIGKSKNTGKFTHQEILNGGMDYTFGVGNGLNVVFEQLVVSYDEKPFRFSNRVVFTGLSLSYPLGISDNLGVIVFYDWTHDAFYNFVNWHKQLDPVSLYLMAFWNPENYMMPQQGDAWNLFAGKGMQVMVVWNH